MASWTIHDGGILGKNRLGFGNFTNSTGGFGSNSALILEGNDFTPPRQMMNAGGGFGSNSVILPKEGDDFTASQSPFGLYPIRQSPPFCTNPTDATPFSSPFGTNSALRNDTNQQTANTVTQPLFGTDPIPIGQSPFSTNPNATPTTPFSSQSRGNEGTWLEPYAETLEQEGDCKCKLSSMSVMPVYFKKSHEELRLEDYQLNGETGSSTTNTYSESLFQPSTSANTGSIPGFSETILPISAEPYNKIDKSPEELRLEDYQLTGKSGSVFGSSLFGRQTANSAATSLFPTPPPSTNPDPYPVGNSTSIFQQTSNVDPTFQQTINSFSTLHPSKFSSSAVSSQFVGHPTGGGQFSSVNSISLFGQTISSPTRTSPFGSRPFSSQISSSGPFYTSVISSSQSPLGTRLFGSQISSTSPFTSSVISSSQSPLGTGPFGSPISLTSHFIASSVISSLQSPMGTSPLGSQISSTSSPFTSGTLPAFSNSPTTESVITSNPEPVSTGGFIPGFGRFGSSTEHKQQPITQWSVFFDPSYVTNPIATDAAAALPKTVQYENSCLPVSDNAERFPLFNVRPLTLDRDTLPFEANEDKKEDNIFIEEFLVVCPNEEQRLDESLSNLSVSDNSINMCNKKGGKKSWKDIMRGDDHSEKESMPSNIFKSEDHEDSYITTHYTDVIAMIPKLTCPDYYMEPSMDDLAANEMKMPGFCRQVKDFVIGRRDYGSIKFLGETDVRNLDLESIVKFGMHDVKVCMDDKAKLPLWQGGVYKAAEITLLNVKCIDKNTGNQYIDGPKVDAYKQLLMRKTVEQGGEFVSFDPTKGEWRFKVEF